MMLQKAIATMLLLFALSLPGVINGLSRGYAIGAVLAGIILFCFMFEAVRAAISKKIYSFGGISPLLRIVGLALLGLYAVASVRSLNCDNVIVKLAATNTLLVHLTTAAGVFTAVAMLRRIEPEALLRNVCLCMSTALAILFTVEVLLLLLQVQHQLYDETPQVREPALVLSMLGFPVGRVLLPISSGMINGAVLPLSGAMLSLLFLSRTRYKLIAYFWLGPLSLALLTLNDTRSFLMAVPVTALACPLIARRAKLVSLITIICPIIPPMIVVLAGVLGPLVKAFASARYDSFGMFSGREFIWGVTYSRWIAADDSYTRYFGSGLYGQVISGVNAYYSEMFGSFSEVGAELASVHNSYLQAVVDIGIVGFATLVTFVFCFASRLSNIITRGGANAAAGTAFLGILIAFAFVAGTEGVISPYSREAIAILLTLFLSVALSADRLPFRKFTPPNTHYAHRYS